MAEKIVLLLGTAADDLADALAPELGARVLRVMPSSRLPHGRDEMHR